MPKLARIETPLKQPAGYPANSAFNNYPNKKNKAAETFPISEKPKFLSRETIRRSFINYQFAEKFGADKDALRLAHFSHFCDIYVDGKPFHVVFGRAGADREYTNNLPKFEPLIMIFDNQENLLHTFFRTPEPLTCRENSILFAEGGSLYSIYPEGKPHTNSLEPDTYGGFRDWGNVWEFNSEAKYLTAYRMRLDEYSSKYKTVSTLRAENIKPDQTVQRTETLTRENIADVLKNNQIENEQVNITNFYHACDLRVGGEIFNVVSLITNTNNTQLSEDKIKWMESLTTASEYRTMILDSSQNIIFYQTLGAQPFFCIENKLFSETYFGFFDRKNVRPVIGNVLSFSDHAETVTGEWVDLEHYTFQELIR